MLEYRSDYFTPVYWPDQISHCTEGQKSIHLRREAFLQMQVQIIKCLLSHSLLRVLLMYVLNFHFRFKCIQMCKYVHIWICINMYAYLHTYLYMCTYVSIYTYTIWRYIYIYTCMYYIDAYKYRYIHPCICSYCINGYTYPYACIHTYIYLYMLYICIIYMLFAFIQIFVLRLY